MNTDILNSVVKTTGILNAIEERVAYSDVLLAAVPWQNGETRPESAFYANVVVLDQDWQRNTTDARRAHLLTAYFDMASMTLTHVMGENFYGGKWSIYRHAHEEIGWKKKPYPGANLASRGNLLIVTPERYNRIYAEIAGGEDRELSRKGFSNLTAGPVRVVTSTHFKRKRGLLIDTTKVTIRHPENRGLQFQEFERFVRPVGPSAPEPAPGVIARLWWYGTIDCAPGALTWVRFRD